MHWWREEQGQAVTEYAILAVMVITSTVFVIQVFPTALSEYYQYAAAWLSLPVG